MGLSASKRVETSLAKVTWFDSAYKHCLSLSQQAFDGVLPYQLLTASDHLHHELLFLPHPPPLILKWVSHPPTRSQVDSALRKVIQCCPQREYHFHLPWIVRLGG